MKKFLSLVLILTMFASMYVFADTTSAEMVTPMIAAGCYQSAALKTDGSLWIWGDFGMLYPPDAPEYSELQKQTTPLKIMDDVVFVSLPNNGAHGSLIKSDNSLWKWGYNFFGYLGDGTTKSTHIPVKIMDDVVYTACGGSYSAAIKSDNTLWLWGYNQKGQLGTGENKTVNIPTKIMNDVKKVSLGTQHSAAIKNDNSLWMWGENKKGKIGDGTTTDKSIPTKIMDDVVDIYLKNDTTYAIKTDGTLWVWGSNEYGEFGVEEPSFSVVPIKVMENVAQVSSCSVLKTDGSVWTWHGIYHSKTGLEFFQPTKIMDDVKNISCAGINMAIKNDNSLWCWNTDTEWASMWIPIGDGTTTSSQIPINIMNLTQFTNADIDTTVLKARKLVKNSSYNYYKTSDSPHTVMANELGNAKLMAGYYHFTEEILKGKTLSNFYEIILYDALINKKYSSTSTDLIEDFNYLANKNAIAKLTKVCQEVYGDAFSDAYYYQTADFLNKTIGADEEVAFMKYFNEEVLAPLGYTISGIRFAGKTMKQIMDITVKAYTLSAVSDSQVKVLRLIKQSTSETELINAADSLIQSIEIAKQNVYAEMFTDNVVDITYETAFNIVKNTLTSGLEAKTPYALLYKYAYKGGKFVADNIYNASELSYDALCIIAINKTDIALRKALEICEENLKNNFSTENAEIMIAAADSLKSLLEFGNDVCISYCEGVAEGNVKAKEFEKYMVESVPATAPLVLIKNIFGSESDSAQSCIKSLTSINTILKSANWYSGYEDISYYLTEVRSTNYSSWATDSIKGAKVLGFLPEYLECNYTENITRAEFATFLVNFIERKSGNSVYSLLEEKELPMVSVPFDDALFVDVDYAYRLGIIKGKGEGKFDPLAQITREEAAVMLTRTIKLLGYDTTAFNYNLPGGISSWANDSVNFVYEKGIMQGDETGFNPKGNITKEQTIATLYRIFYNV